MKYLRLFGKIVGIFILILLFVYGVLVVGVRPSNDRDWNIDQAVLPTVDIKGNLVSIHNIRNFSYTSTRDFTPSYYDATFDLEKIKNVYFIVEPFSGSASGAAHTLSLIHI